MWIRLWFDNDGKPHQRVHAVDPDPVAGTFAIEFAIHDGPARSGRNSLSSAILISSTVMGSSFALPTPAPDGWLIAGDAASLPAINSLLEAIAVRTRRTCPSPSGWSTSTMMSTPCPADARRPSVERVARGTDGTAIVDAVRADVSTPPATTAGWPPRLRRRARSPRCYGGTTDWVDPRSRRRRTGSPDRSDPLGAKHFGRTDFRGPSPTTSAATRYPI